MTPEKPQEKKEIAPPPFAASGRDLDMTLMDGSGVILARITAKRGTVGQASADGGAAAAMVVALGGKAILHEKGKPIATFEGDRITGDRATGTVRGEGNVIARSLTSPGSPTVRADRMTWRPGTNKIVGDGNVLITREPSFRFPGSGFVADTKLQNVEITGSGSPITGTL